MICHIKINNYLIETTDAFDSFVTSRDEIIKCYSMSGDWDYLLRILVGDVEDYNHFLMRTVLRQPFGCHGGIPLRAVTGKIHDRSADVIGTKGLCKMDYRPSHAGHIPVGNR